MAMANWPRVVISDLCESIIDCVNKTAPAVNEVTRYKMIRTTNVRDGWVNLDEIKFVSEETYKVWTRRQVPRRGDVILTREAPLGGVGMLRTNESVFLGQRLVSYRADPKKLDNRFLLYAFQADDVQTQVRALGSGSTVEHMRVPDAEKLTLRLPPLLLQQRIADILSAYDDLIENNTRRIKILEEMVRSLYREWFVNLRFPGHGYAGSTKSSARSLPAGWSAGTLGDVLILQRGYDLPEHSRLPGSVPIISSSGTTGTHNVAKVDPPGIVTGRYGTLGAVYLLHEPFWPLNTTLFVKDFKGSDPYWALYLLRSLNFSNQNAAGAVPGVNRNALHMMSVQIPPRELQARFGATVKPLLLLVDLLRQKNVKLAEQRDLLLPRLLSGEIDVSSLPLPSSSSSPNPLLLFPCTSTPPR